MLQNFSRDLDSDIPKYKKKKKNSSKSNKRSNHKHQYIIVIMQGFVGWIWGEECQICGRIKSNHFIDRDFIRPEYRNYPYISEKTYYSYEELKKIYPDIKIIKSHPWDFS